MNRWPRSPAAAAEILPLIERLRDTPSPSSMSPPGWPLLADGHLDQGRVRLARRPKCWPVPRAAAQPVRRRCPSSTGNFDTHLADFGVTLLRHPAGQIVIPGRIDPGAARVQVIVRATNVTLAIGARPSNISVRTACPGAITEIDTDDGRLRWPPSGWWAGIFCRPMPPRLAIAKLGLDAATR